MSEIPTKTVPIDSISPHPENYNQHPELQIAELVESADSFGQFKNIVVWSPDSEIDLGNGQKLYPDISYILAGHGFWLASRRAGRDTIEVKDYTGLLYEDALMLMQVDNAAPLGAQSDPDKLKILLQKTRERAADRPKLGAMLARLRESAGISENGEGAKDEPGAIVDKAEQLQEKWQVKPGDIWQIGRHRLICGDCRDVEVVKAVCGGDKVNGVFTSPPYAEQRKKQYGGVPAAEYVEWWEAIQENIREVLAEDGSFFVNIKPHSEDGQRTLYVFDLVCKMVRQWQWAFIDELCWVRKALPGYWPNRFKNAFEPIYHFASNNKPKFNPQGVLQPFAVKEYANSPTYDQAGNMSFGNGGTRRSKNFEGALPDNVLRIETGITQKDSGAYHQAYFPPQLPTFFIKAYSDPADIWLDPFAGSGTTILAAHKEGRIGLGIERLEKYVAVSLERFKEGIGVEPELIGRTLTHQDPVLLSE